MSVLQPRPGAVPQFGVARFSDRAADIKVKARKAQTDVRDAEKKPVQWRACNDPKPGSIALAVCKTTARERCLISTPIERSPGGKRGKVALASFLRSKERHSPVPSFRGVRLRKE